MSGLDLSKMLAAGKEAALLAGAIQKERLGRGHEVNLKGVANLVTEVDVMCEKTIIERIRRDFPAHSFLAEEGGETAPGSDHLWIIDPLDGTTNYAHDFPRFCVSIGLAIRGQVMAGVVHNAVADETFTAIRGGGAFKNGERLHVSKVGKVEDALICTGFSYDKGPRLGRDLNVYLTVLPVAQSVRRTGCAALDICDVACGRFDAFWEFNLNPWDVAAASLLVEEAGGRISGIHEAGFDLYSKQFTGSNGKIHDELIGLFHGPAQYQVVIS